jgi:hypothetical protein
MAFVPAPNIIEVEFRYLLNAQKCENRLMVDNLAAVDAAALEATAILCWNWWETEYAPAISASCLLSAVVATDLTTIDGEQFTYAPDGTTTGGNTGGAMPNEVALCVSLKTGHRGRSARGRWYLAGLPREAMVDDNNVTTGYASDVADHLQTLINDISTAGQAAAIVSFISEGAPRPGGPVYFPITSATVSDTLVDSMKSRKPGVGT